jgi:predicted cobalt transporter CbtA
MTARAFLVRGLVVGLLAGFATFLVAHQVGEPHVEAAIALEEAADGHAHTHAEDAQEGTVVSRDHQRTWGLLTGSLGVGTALGGLVALVSAAAAGRMGSLRPGQSTALVAAVGFVSMALVPFLKYPATPPAVGDADTIGLRTGEYFGFQLISVLAAVAATALAVRLAREYGAYRAVVGATAGYLVVVVAAGQLLPTVNEVGDFPADTLWYFRRASLITLATMWAAIGVLLTGLVGRLDRAATTVRARRELAASL